MLKFLCVSGITAINSQERYWFELGELKTHTFYLQSFHLEAVRIDTYIEVFLAFVSSGSIAGWIIWSKAQFVWATIIALSQVISAIRPHLPYQKRARHLEALKIELDDLVLYAEEKWYLVSEGLLTEAEIHDLTLDIKRKKQKALNLYIAAAPLPFNSTYLEQATIQSSIYFRKGYLGGQDDE